MDFIFNITNQLEKYGVDKNVIATFIVTSLAWFIYTLILKRETKQTVVNSKAAYENALGVLRATELMLEQMKDISKKLEKENVDFKESQMKLSESQNKINQALDSLAKDIMDLKK